MGGRSMFLVLILFVGLQSWSAQASTLTFEQFKRLEPADRALYIKALQDFAIEMEKSQFPGEATASVWEILLSARAAHAAQYLQCFYAGHIIEVETSARYCDLRKARNANVPRCTVNGRRGVQCNTVLFGAPGGQPLCSTSVSTPTQDCQRQFARKGGRVDQVADRLIKMEKTEGPQYAILSDKLHTLCAKDAKQRKTFKQDYVCEEFHKRTAQLDKKLKDAEDKRLAEEKVAKSAPQAAPASPASANAEGGGRTKPTIQASPINGDQVRVNPVTNTIIDSNPAIKPQAGKMPTSSSMARDAEVENPLPGVLVTKATPSSETRTEGFVPTPRNPSAESQPEAPKAQTQSPALPSTEVSTTGKSCPEGQRAFGDTCVTIVNEGVSPSLDSDAKKDSATPAQDSAAQKAKADTEAAAKAQVERDAAAKANADVDAAAATKAKQEAEMIEKAKAAEAEKRKKAEDEKQKAICAKVRNNCISTPDEYKCIENKLPESFRGLDERNKAVYLTGDPTTQVSIISVKIRTALKISVDRSKSPSGFIMQGAKWNSYSSKSTPVSDDIRKMCLKGKSTVELTFGDGKVTTAHVRGNKVIIQTKESGYNIEFPVQIASSRGYENMRSSIDPRSRSGSSQQSGHR